MRFNYIIFDHVDKDHSPGVIYYTSEPDTIPKAIIEEQACIFYKFDNQSERDRYIPINRIKVTKDEIIYFGKGDNVYYKIIFNKKYGDFAIAKRALLPKNKHRMFFHRDYDYYEELTVQ
tara:strand:+ start:473 stop:829 length:357 start_codon:yes stop_codon:yes gene_type:complete